MASKRMIQCNPPDKADLMIGIYSVVKLGGRFPVHFYVGI